MISSKCARGGGRAVTQIRGARGATGPALGRRADSERTAADVGRGEDEAQNDAARMRSTPRVSGSFSASRSALGPRLMICAELVWQPPLPTSADMSVTVSTDGEAANKV